MVIKPDVLFTALPYSPIQFKVGLWNKADIILQTSIMLSLIESGFSTGLLERAG
jgi:hypothetical protein